MPSYSPPVRDVRFILDHLLGGAGIDEDLLEPILEEAARLCDRLAIMERGLIIAEGTPKALVEEHVSPQVIELRTDHRSLERLLPIVEAASDAVERTGEDRLLAYTEDVEALLEDVRSSGVEIENTAYRHTGLEDVFLRLTGRRLVE